MLIRLFWGCGGVGLSQGLGQGGLGQWGTGQGGSGRWGMGQQGPSWVWMLSSAREEGFQIFMYFVHYSHFLRLQIDWKIGRNTWTLSFNWNVRDGDNNTEVLVQYFKLVTFHDRPPLYDTPHPPSVSHQWHHVTSHDIIGVM